MATASSVPAWRIPETGEPRGLTSMGSQRVRHNCSDLAAAAAAGVVEKGEKKIDVCRRKGEKMKYVTDKILLQLEIKS